MTYQNQFSSAACTGKAVNSEPLSYIATYKFWFCLHFGLFVSGHLYWRDWQ